ncbi:increased loss of mitochondrial DNA protein 1 [Aspergillus caelatus]|uniref:Increased loss of mitochondrial DNA protein 1 n=2 Tax=Aspergillus subgen. Circumdati TaxID=2720871 RepID=A0A5N7A9K6_9EURO|nr:increased loss of mitochondrial DNA protein 1 [Aspergillus caelatus]KAE8365809.1 increased loss of mitochondrial DNA protein 1 [Aspergillus caelatus]KAE8414941.1 increased loss of mitochondrial DNA protein 1 [Aspergillus pseudocaelatus]
MGLLSSKTLIQAHALCLFILAVYLTKSPEVITDSDVVFMLGETLQIDAAPSLSRPQSPFALCGILLVADALVDLILVTKVPRINEIIAMAEIARSAAPTSIAGAMRTNPFLARLASLYTEIWTLLSASRFCLFFAVSFFIYQSKPSDWGVDVHQTVGGYGQESSSGLDQLKNRVIFTYGFMEMMFWLWIFLTLREERHEIAVRFAEQDQQLS